MNIHAGSGRRFNLETGDDLPLLIAGLLSLGAELDDRDGELVPTGHQPQAKTYQPFRRGSRFAKRPKHAFLDQIALHVLALDPHAQIGICWRLLDDLHQIGRRRLGVRRIDHVHPEVRTEEAEGDEQQNRRLVPLAYA